MGIRPLVLAAVLVTGCGSDNPPPPPATGGSGSNTTASTVSSTAAATTTTTSGASTAGDTGPSEACKACWNGACDPEIQACFLDDTCACLFDCERDNDCERTCGQSEIFGGLIDCILDATIGPCIMACDAQCQACFLQVCMAQFEACTADDVCLCKFRCDDNTQCQDDCGGPNAVWDQFGVCFVEVAGVECVDQCS